MSYDIAIESDHKPKALAELQGVRALFAEIPHMAEIGQRRFQYDDGIRYFESWLDIVDEDGNTLIPDPKRQESDVDQDGVRDKVNVITTSVPYGFSGLELMDMLDVCFQIATRLGWRVFDQQLGDYVE